MGLRSRSGWPLIEENVVFVFKIMHTFIYGLWFQGNEYTLLYKGNVPVRSGVENNVGVRFFPGNWYTIDPDTKVENLASRQDLMMALQDINQILIRFVTLVNNKQTTIRANFNLLLAGGVLITFVSGPVRLYSHFGVPVWHDIWYVLLFCTQDSVLPRWPGDKHNWDQHRLSRPQKQWAKQSSLCRAMYLSYWLQRTVLWGNLTKQIYIYTLRVFVLVLPLIFFTHFQVLLSLSRPQPEEDSFKYSKQPN